jgi:hypothetical protein
MTDIVKLLEGLLSSVPEAVQLFNKIAPQIAPNAAIEPAVLDEIEMLAPVAIAAVQTSQAAIATLVNAHPNLATPPAEPSLEAA